jgi:uncharacterized repeat protein (TIGR02543 family)
MIMRVTPEMTESLQRLAELRRRYLKAFKRGGQRDKADQMAQMIAKIVAQVPELFRRLELAGDGGRIAVATAEYQALLQKALEILGEKYYLDVLTNPELWDDAVARARAVENAIAAFVDQIVDNMRQANASQDLRFQVSLDALSRGKGHPDPDLPGVTGLPPTAAAPRRDDPWGSGRAATAGDYWPSGPAPVRTGGVRKSARLGWITGSVIVALCLVFVITGCANQDNSEANRDRHSGVTTQDAGPTAGQDEQQGASDEATVEDQTPTVRFDPNGGECDTGEREVAYNQEYGELPQPVRFDYDFEGWFTEKEGGTKVGGSTIVTVGRDHTLYAQWKLKPETYLVDMTRYEWVGDGDKAFDIVSRPGESSTDVHGNEYWYGSLGLQGYSSKVNISTTPASVVYDIAGNYNTLSGIWTYAEMEDGEYWFEVYGDEKLLFTSDKITVGSAVKPFSIDVSGVQLLKLSIQSSYQELGWPNHRVQYRIFDPTLHR